MRHRQNKSKERTDYGVLAILPVLGAVGCICFGMFTGEWATCGVLTKNIKLDGTIKTVTSCSSFEICVKEILKDQLSLTWVILAFTLVLCVMMFLFIICRLNNPSKLFGILAAIACTAALVNFATFYFLSEDELYGKCTLQYTFWMIVACPVLITLA
eukprot:216052_1